MYEQIEANKRKTFLLIFLFIVVLIGIGYAVDQITESGVVFLPVAIVYALVMTLVSYFASDKIALSLNGAKGPIEKVDHPYVYRMVENLAITAGLPMPRVYLIDDPAPNAFATGRNPAHAAIALTTGIIERLENEELEGVIAHELAHVQNYDIRVMAIVAVLVGAVIMLSDYLFRWGFIFGGRGSNRNSNSGSAVAIVGLVLLILSPIIAQLIKLAVSRKREFLADASGALLTRYPEGLARALEKIASSKMPMRKANNSTAHLFIANPFAAKARRGLARLFATHPPIAERIKALHNM